MKKGLLYLIAAVALVGCSKQEEGTRSTESDMSGSSRSASAMTNEAAGAANSNAPSMQTPATPSMTPGMETNTTNSGTTK